MSVGKLPVRALSAEGVLSDGCICVLRPFVTEFSVVPDALDVVSDCSAAVTAESSAVSSYVVF